MTKIEESERSGTKVKILKNYVGAHDEGSRVLMVDWKQLEVKKEWNIIKINFQFAQNILKIFSRILRPIFGIIKVPIGKDLFLTKLYLFKLCF